MFVASVFCSDMFENIKNGHEQVLWHPWPFLESPTLETTIILTCPLSPCGWLTFSFTVHTHNTDTVLSIGQQVYMEMER